MAQTEQGEARAANTTSVPEGYETKWLKRGVSKFSLPEKLMLLPIALPIWA